MKRPILRLLAVAIMGALITGCAAMKMENNLPRFYPQTFSSDMHKQNIDNFIVIIDSSFSMMTSYNERFMLTLGKAIIDRMNQTMPKNLILKTGLISYGHSSEGKNVIKLMYGLTDYSQDSFKSELDKIGPTMGGDLKISDAIALASDTLIDASGKSAIIIVTDGKGKDEALETAAVDAEKKLGGQLSIYSILVGDVSESVQWVETISNAEVSGFAVNADYILSGHKMADFVKKVFMTRSLDSDGDSVYDCYDKCPNTEAGTEVGADGCRADQDRDGAYDSMDQCPDTMPGIKTDETGCPIDNDKDGISYLYDQCPGTPTNVLVNKRGCPVDNDKDRVYDYQDDCAATPLGVKVDQRGCPIDTDRDGVYDHQDACPRTMTGIMVNSRGCFLDSDNDGVYDPNDTCLETPAGVRVDVRGCPFDSDNDGVYNFQDVCPQTPAGIMVDSRGCTLDRDNDGVYDSNDTCIETPTGVKVDSRGCPFDSDKDGVYDYRDICPSTSVKAWKVDDQGCWISKKIFFDYNKSAVTDSSALILKDEAKALIAHQWLNIELWAHTDSIGSQAYNLTLAKKRGNAARDYLISLGIEPSRVSVFAEGLKSPSYKNATKEGRAFNRRVEIRIVR